MWKLLFLFLISAQAHAQVFTEDISKLEHFIAADEVDSYLKAP